MKNLSSIKWKRKKKLSKSKLGNQEFKENGMPKLKLLLIKLMLRLNSNIARLSLRPNLLRTRLSRRLKLMPQK